MKPRLYLLLSLAIMFIVASCHKFNSRRSYGVVVFIQNTQKGTDSVVVIDFQQGDSATFDISGGYMLGTAVYSYDLHAFGYYGGDGKYHFYNRQGEEVLTLDLPQTLHAVRIDDSLQLLMGMVTQDNRDAFVGYNYSTGQQVFSYDLGQSRAYPICCSAYNPRTGLYYIFALGAEEKAYSLMKISIDSGFVSESTIGIDPVLTVFDHESGDLVVLGRLPGDTTDLRFYLFRINPDSAAVLDTIRTDISIVQACSAGLDYERQAFVTMTLDSAENDQVVFIDLATGETIERHTIPDGQTVLFWRE